MRRVTLLCLFVFVACHGIAAQDSQRKVSVKQKTGATAAAPSKTPTISQILEKYVQALGGKAALNRLTTRVIKGRYEASLGAEGTLQIFAKAPNKSLTVTTLPQVGEVREGFDGTTAWRQDGQSKPREKTGAELANVKLEADFSRSLKLAQLYPSLRLVGIEKVGERPAYLLDAATAEGNPEKLAFDVESGLLLKRVTQRESPLGKLVIETFYEDYREVDGVKIPFLTRRVTSAASSTLTYEEVKHNLPVEDKIFQKPPVE
jgi:hypothetical protein